MFDLIKQIEISFEPYRANFCELSDIDFLEKFLLGYHAAKSSSANLQFSLKTVQLSSFELQSDVTILKQVFIIILTSKT